MELNQFVLTWNKPIYLFFWAIFPANELKDHSKKFSDTGADTWRGE